MSAACCLIARVHRNRTITPADKVRAPDLKGCRREFTSPVSAFECAFWDGTPGLCTRRPDRIPLDRARWVWQSPCGLMKIVTYTGTEFVISRVSQHDVFEPVRVVTSSPCLAPLFYITARSFERRKRRQEHQEKEAAARMSKADRSPGGAGRAGV